MRKAGLLHNLAAKFSTTTKDGHQEHAAKPQATTQNVVVKVLDEMQSDDYLHPVN
jgi:hypothetical protein